VVTRVDLDVGEWSKPGDALMRLVNSASSYLNVSVSRQATQGLTPGMRLPVRVEGLGNPLPGRVTFVSPVADAASGLVELRVAFDNPNAQVRPGATGRIQIPPR
jgi:multidrug efflux pump subunit AcrA (membrane-fusion protein)